MNKQENIYFENGHLNDDAVALYADGLLENGTTALQEAVLVHVAECTSCKDKIIDLTTFLRNPDTVPMAPKADPVAEYFRTEGKRPWYAAPMRIAAVFFAITLMVGTFYYVHQDGQLFPGNDDDQQVTTPLDSQTTTVPGTNNADNSATQPAQPTPILTPAPQTTTPTVPKTTVKKPVQRTMAFIPNPTLEALIDDKFRSGVYQVFSPKNNMKVTGNIHFKWQNLNAKQTLTLKIFDNDNMLFQNIQYDVKGSGFVFKEKLPPGLYYWKLETAEKLHYVGKFIVK